MKKNKYPESLIDWINLAEGLDRTYRKNFIRDWWGHSNYAIIDKSMHETLEWWESKEMEDKL